MNKKSLTFSKKLFIFYSLMTSIWITWSFILATIGRDEIAQDLASQIVIICIPLILGYFAKSFLENKEENRLDFEKQLANLLPQDSIEIEGVDDDLEEEEDNE